MSPSRSVASFASLVLGLLTLTACGDTGLQPGLDANVIDTISLYAVDGTALDLPSAFSIAKPNAVRTDLTTNFDFVFNLTPLDSAVFLPTGAVHLGIGSAIQKMAAGTSFDAVTMAPGGVYVDSLPVVVDSGTVVVVRSRPVSQSALSVCVTGIGYLYAKLQVLAIDTLARRIDLKILANQNCGYRSLTPGNPKQ
jgi:hypothetical protein